MWLILVNKHLAKNFVVHHVGGVRVVIIWTVWQPVMRDHECQSLALPDSGLTDVHLSVHEDKPWQVDADALECLTLPQGHSPGR